MAETLIEPKAQAPEPQTASPSTDLPDELLQLPAVQGLFSGAPPAFSTPITAFEKRPEAKLIADNKDALQRAGVGLYRSLAGDLGVLFNQLYISGNDVAQADKEGRLLEVAPPFDQVSQSISQSGEDNPVLNAAVPNGAKTAGVPTPGPTPAPAPASVQNKLTTARLKNIPQGAPTSGPAPGAGRILNSIMKPVV